MKPKMTRVVSCLAPVVCVFLAPASLFGLDPHKAITQYPRTVWTQQQGLPQDTIRAITQTSDGYLWLGTDEGLARFDGYEFIRFTKDDSALPGNSITALLAAKDGSLWIGTPNGLTRYSQRHFTTYTTRDGLADNVVTALFEDHDGGLWIAAGIYLTRFQDGRFVNYPLSQVSPIRAVRAICEDKQHTLFVAGYGGLVKRTGDRFVRVLGPENMGDDIVVAMLGDREGNIWIGGSDGLLVVHADGTWRLFGLRDGLPANPVRSLCEDRDGNLWAGTNGGLSRLENGRFVAADLEGSPSRDWVRSLFEDREGNLWVGMNSGLNRLRDGRFTIYGRAEGLPSDEPLTVHQDPAGRVWVGYHGGGLVSLPGSGMENAARHLHSYTTGNGLASSEIFSIRDNPDGGLLLSTRGGLNVMAPSGLTTLVPKDALSRRLVFDALKDRKGTLWVAAPGGVYQISRGVWHNVLPGGPLLNQAALVLCETRDGTIWAGTYGEGLWQIRDGGKKHFTTTDGLGSNAIRSIYEDPDGTLWIGTFGGGLNSLREGVFRKFTARDGLLSDNIWHIEDDQTGWLWLSTTRGICRIAKQQLHDLAAGVIHSLMPVNYGLDDGLRSAQCAPGFPAGAGGTRTADGRLWFPTSKGLAVFDPKEPSHQSLPPIIHLTEVRVNGGPIDTNGSNQLPPGSGRMQFRFAAIHLRAPERVQYAYRLEGLDRDWSFPGERRTINYNSLRHGSYRFVVKAMLPDGDSTEASFPFELRPRFFETVWFRFLAVLAALLAVYGVYQLRLQQIRSRFALVLEERARIAREIHDTLAQGFVGISSQLEAVALALNTSVEGARKHLEMARKMARHSLTEARRSVMDLRASALDGQDLSEALASAARQWAAGTAVTIEMSVTGQLPKLPEEVEQHLLRIAQEAVANALKHACPRKIRIGLRFEPRKLWLRVEDDGRGFEPGNAFNTLGGHFGLLGMRERAERIGGELHLLTSPGTGTQVEVSAPFSS